MAVQGRGKVYPCERRCRGAYGHACVPVYLCVIPVYQAQWDCYIFGVLQFCHAYISLALHCESKLKVVCVEILKVCPEFVFLTLALLSSKIPTYFLKVEQEL